MSLGPKAAPKKPKSGLKITPKLNIGPPISAPALCTIFPILVPFLTFLRWDLQIHIFWLQITWILLNWRFLNSGDLIGDLAVANLALFC